MKFLTQKNFENILIFFLVAGCMYKPADCAWALLFIVCSQGAERFFTRNVSDKDREAFRSLKAEVEKHTAALQKENLSKAFGGQR